MLKKNKYLYKLGKRSQKNCLGRREGKTKKISRFKTTIR